MRVLNLFSWPKHLAAYIVEWIHRLAHVEYALLAAGIRVWGLLRRKEVTWPQALQLSRYNKRQEKKKTWHIVSVSMVALCNYVLHLVAFAVCLLAPS